MLDFTHRTFKSEKYVNEWISKMHDQMGMAYDNLSCSHECGLSFFF